MAPPVPVWFLVLAFTAVAHSPLGAAVSQTLIGTGVAGYSGDGGPGFSSQLNNPFGLVRGPDGALYLCDTGNHAIRRLDSQGNLTTVAGTGRKGHAGDGGKATLALLNEPYEVRFDSGGNMFFVEMQNHLVGRVDAKSGVISTVVGTGEAGFGGDGGAAADALLNRPHSIQFDQRDNLYICDIGNHRIRTVNRESGIISTFAGTGEQGPTPDGSPIAGTPLNGPRAIDFDEKGDMWLALREGNAVYLLAMGEGTVHHRAGTGKKGFTGNGGSALEATLSGPKGIAVGPDGNVYLADTESHSIRMIEVLTRRLVLIAGTGMKGDGPDGPALEGRMARPHGIFVGHDGTIYVGDSEAHRVRAIRR